MVRNLIRSETERGGGSAVHGTRFGINGQNRAVGIY
jgi:hypothetical protein